MKEFIRIGVDLAKNYFQVHAMERIGIERSERDRGVNDSGTLIGNDIANCARGSSAISAARKRVSSGRAFADQMFQSVYP